MITAGLFYFVSYAKWKSGVCYLSESFFSFKKEEMMKSVSVFVCKVILTVIVFVSRVRQPLKDAEGINVLCGLINSR